MRRRRRSNGTWLPTLGAVIGEDLEVFLSGRAWATAVVAQDINTSIFPVTHDAPTYKGDAATSSATMGDIIGNEYFLDRIVGKVFIDYKPGNDGLTTFYTWPILVCCGFFVARADDNDYLVPIGTSSNAEERDNYAPSELDTIREPWIWRRAWILGIQGNYDLETTQAGSADGQAGGSWPSSTAGYHSVLDGPHIDCKTKRRVGQDDRLFFACSVSYTGAFGGPSVDPVELPSVRGYLDYRLHGHLRKARPTGRF